MFSTIPKTGTCNRSNIATAFVASSSEIVCGVLTTTAPAIGASCTMLGQGHSDVAGYGGLAHAALVGGDGDDVLYALDRLLLALAAVAAHLGIERDVGDCHAGDGEQGGFDRLLERAGQRTGRRR